jgi:tetratricopeptide (TPR) repeat protein
MQLRSPRVSRWSLLLTIVGIAVVTMPVSLQSVSAQASTLVRVRAALAHGDVAAARSAAAGGQAERELGLALVEIFVGQDDAARARLLPLAEQDQVGEAALELGLLDLRRGRREEAEPRLQRLAAVRTFNSADDYFRLARAAIGVREFLLANDAFQRVADAPRPDIQSTWGDMFVLRHRNGDAAASYRAALEADPAWVPAHVGLALALMDENPEAARAGLEAARKLAPDHPDLLLATVQLDLLEKDEDGAEAALDRLAAVRPGTVVEAAYRTALAFEDGGMAAAEAAMAAVRAADPRSALGYRVAGEQAARNFQFADAVALARKGTELDPDDPFAFFILGLFQMRTGDEAAARTALERSWSLDASAPVTKNLLDLLDDLDTFVTVSVDDMIFKFDPGEAAVLEPYAVPLAREAYATFAKRYGFTPEGPILIEIFPSHDDFAVRTLGLPGLRGALGACFGRVVTMDSPRALQPGEFSWHATLWHEMAHVFSLQLSQYRVPRWLTEGISVFEEHRRRPAWGRELTLEYARELSLGRTFGVKGLPDAFKRPESLALAYFEASLVVEHLVAQNGDAGLRTLLLAYAGGATDAEAFSKAFGRTIDDAEASFAQFVSERYGALAEAMKVPPQARPDDLGALRSRAASEPGSFVAQFELGQALHGAGDLDGAKTALERAARLAPQARRANSPRVLLASIAQKEGDQPKAREELRALLEYDHENVEAARVLLTLATGAPADMDYALRLIADLDPFDADAHGLLGRRLFEQSEFAPALIEFEAALALGPPNLAEAHTDLAATFLKLGRRDEAKRAALEALKEAPTFARAQDLLLEAIGR